MDVFQNNLTKWHLRIMVAVWLVFTGLTLYIVRAGLDDAGRRPGQVALTTAATVLGPMTGAISRDFQGCCLDFSLRLLPVCLGGLAVAIAFQFVRLGTSVWMQLVRLFVWSAGLVVWFGGGIVSFGHALS